MNFREHIKQIAIQLSNSLQMKDAELEREQAALELELGRVKTQRDLISGSFQRAMDFRPEIDGRLQCPDCFTKRGASSEVTPVPGGHREDRFKCSVCGFQFSTPA